MVNNWNTMVGNYNRFLKNLNFNTIEIEIFYIEIKS